METVYVVVQSRGVHPLILTFTTANRAKDARKALVEGWAGGYHSNAEIKTWWSKHRKGYALSVCKAVLELVQ